MSADDTPFVVKRGEELPAASRKLLEYVVFQWGGAALVTTISLADSQVNTTHDEPGLEDHHCQMTRSVSLSSFRNWPWWCTHSLRGWPQQHCRLGEQAS